MEQQLKLTFYGGTGTVTGANFLVEVAGETPVRFLIDCGLFQGNKSDDARNFESFPYDPATIDALIITHAHLDHIGRVPRLVKEGFQGPIYSTGATKEIAALSLDDTVSLLSRHHNDANNQDEAEPLYTLEDVAQALSQWQIVDYHQPFTLGPLDIVFRDAGHILGSALVECTRGNKKLVFTGDLGNSPSPLLKDTEAIKDATYLVMESVYGDRDHEDRSRRAEQFEDVIEDTLRRDGTLLIPVFSIERAQEIMFEIEQMMEASRIPLVPVFIDSPLAIRVTDVYKKYRHYLNNQVKEGGPARDGIFRFPQLHLTLSTEESKAILRANPRKIILAGSGMSTGGRILHHEKNYLSDSRNTLLLVGYQGVGTFGRILQDGAKIVRILGEEVTVSARIASIFGYSGHKDGSGLLNFVRGTGDTVKKVFVVMGEPKSALFLVQRIRDYLGIEAIAPAVGESVELEL
ncbi:MAG: MBL fold metallo-hydrolase [Candidatus Vogelbacteria bacterium]|nr:MBL fold metallo-hydrolase [Candidatus Vogelbacteria bacterium]